jgi:hypothetical protein
MRACGWLLVVLAGCVPAARGGLAPALQLEVANAPDAWDDVAWGDGRLILGAGELGAVFAVTPDGQVTKLVSGLGQPFTAHEGRGFLLVGERSKGELSVFRADGSAKVGSAPAAGLDYVRWIPGTREVWVTAPGTGIRTFTLADDGSLTAGAVIITEGKPEGLTPSRDGTIALVHLGGGKLGVFDVARHELRAAFATGCASLHGFPQLDDERGFLFAGCGERAEMVVLRRDDGAVLGRFGQAGAPAVSAWSQQRRHFYLRADPGVPVAVLEISDAGAPRELKTFDATAQGHVLAADDGGHLWVPDATAGRVLRFDD